MEWISINDKLPEIGVTILFYGVGHRVDISENPGEDWEDITPNIHLGWYMPTRKHAWTMSYPRYATDITHWMPLPKPPK